MKHVKRRRLAGFVVSCIALLAAGRLTTLTLAQVDGTGFGDLGEAAPALLQRLGLQPPREATEARSKVERGMEGMFVFLRYNVAADAAVEPFGLVDAAAQGEPELDRGEIDRPGNVADWWTPQDGRVLATSTESVRTSSSRRRIERVLIESEGTRRVFVSAFIESTE